MGTEWDTVSVVECAADEPYSTQIGPFGNKIRAHIYTLEGVPVLRGTNVNTSERFYDDGFVYVSHEYAASELHKFMCRAGDVVLCHKGTLGKIGIIPEESRFEQYAMGNSMMKVRCNTARMLPLFLYYWLCSPEGQNYLYSRVSQVGVPQIQRPLSTLREARLPCPPLPEQKAIAAILGALDDKIELNRRMNETLEDLCRTIFKSWFVEFDGHDDLVETDYGRIPIGWSTSVLGDHITLQRGTTYKGKLVGMPGPALLGLGSIEPGGGFRDGRYKTYGGECPEKLTLHPGDLFVALKGATKDGSMVGSIARVPPSVPSGRLTQDTVKLQWKHPHADLDRYLYWLLLTPEYRSYCAGRITGSAQVGLSRDDFLNYPVPIPPRVLLCNFAGIEESLTKRKDAANSESATLAQLRDLLLPKLISGELRVPDAEKLAEAVL